MIKYCIFDIGNVCYPYSPKPLHDYIRHSVDDKKSFDKMGGIYSFDFDPLLKGEISFSQFCQDLCFHFGLSFSENLEKIFYSLEHECIGSFIPETKQLMQELSSKGYEICLLSNITPDLEDIVPQSVDADKRFLSYELGMIKPDIEIYKYVLDKLHARPEETLFIDDLPVNISAAQKLGMNGLVFHQKTIIRDVHDILFSCPQKLLDQN
ncbi:MAG: HAD family phosphatase [Alphaproteobacteria bacterium]|nr:HAD family phosphatase [Alphaproteobacteria bacterium]